MGVGEGHNSSLKTAQGHVSAAAALLRDEAAAPEDMRRIVRILLMICLSLEFRWIIAQGCMFVSFITSHILFIRTCGYTVYMFVFPYPNITLKTHT